MRVLILAAMGLMISQTSPNAADQITACGNLAEADNAIRACTSIIDAGGGDRAVAWAFNNRALAFAKRGDYLRALADYDMAVALAPDSPAAWSNRGNLRAALGDLIPALADHEKALELEPGAAKHWHNRGVDHEEMGDHRAALRDYRKSLELDPSHPGSHIGLATANCKLSRAEASAEARLAAINKGVIDVIGMQELLKSEGFYAGPIDGKFGRGSRAALRAWTRQGCLPQS